MESLGHSLTSWELMSPRTFWIAAALGLFFLFLPPLWRRKRITLDLTFWRRLGAGSKAFWVLPILAVLITLLMAAALADPQVLTERTLPIYGRPVLVIVDVSGSMGYVGKRGEDLAGFEKAHQILNEVLDGDLEADFGLLFFSSENYIARYFAPKKDLLKDTLDVTEEIREISYGTRMASALSLGRRFLSDKVKAKEKSLVIISDLQESPSALAETTEELEKILKAGVKVYVVVLYQENWWNMNNGSPSIPIQLQGLDMVGMNDRSGISRIRREIASMTSSPLREETVLSRTSLIPHLALSILGLVAVCLILSETCFRRIP